MTIDGEKTGGIRAWYMVFVLLAAYTLSFVDRQILNLLVEPIKHDLHLSDTRVSLLQGFAFAIFLGIGGLPIGRFVDKGRRITIVAIGIALWSLMTGLCGLAQGFGILLLCRMGVGIGEATLSPSAYSLIADSFPAERLGLAIGTYSIGVYLGGGLALLGGAAAIAHIHDGVVMMPLIGPVHGWQAIFLFVGFPGLLVSAWIASVREPRRTGAVRIGGLPMADVVAYFTSNAATLTCLFLALSFAAMTSYGVMAWTPSFFIRSYGWTAIETGRLYGAVNIIFGTLGVLCGGSIGDFLTARGVRTGRVRVMACGGLAAAPFIGLAPLVENPLMAMALLAPMTFFVTVTIGTAPSALQEVVPNQMRGIFSACGVLIVNLIGLGLGPTAIALVTDYIIGDEQKLRYGLAIVPSIALLISSGLAFAAFSPYASSRDSLERWRPSFN